MRHFMKLGMAASGCLLILGLAMSCTVIGLGLGLHWVLAGAIGMAAFGVLQKIVR